LPEKEILTSFLILWIESRKLSFRKSLLVDEEVDEFVIASMDPNDGEVVITVYCQDFVGAVGLFEIGKNILIQSNNGIE